MGKLLISGEGKGNSAIGFWRLMHILYIAAGGVFIYISKAGVQNTFSVFGLPLSYTTKHQYADFLYYWGIIMIILSYMCNNNYRQYIKNKNKCL